MVRRLEPGIKNQEPRQKLKVKSLEERGKKNEERKKIGPWRFFAAFFVFLEKDFVNFVVR